MDKKYRGSLSNRNRFADCQSVMDKGLMYSRGFRIFKIFVERPEFILSWSKGDISWYSKDFENYTDTDQFSMLLKIDDNPS